MRYRMTARIEKIITCHPATPIVGNVRILMSAADVMRMNARRLILNPVADFSGISNSRVFSSTAVYNKNCS
jgi:hypothetical protein